MAQADKTLRPFLLLDLRTLRPPTVFMRALKPQLFLRALLLGW